MPRTRIACDDPSVIGTPFFVMDYVAARLYRSPRLERCAPGERAEVYLGRRSRAGGAACGRLRGRRAGQLRPPRPVLRTTDQALDGPVRRRSDGLDCVDGASGGVATGQHPRRRRDLDRARRRAVGEHAAAPRRAARGGATRLELSTIGHPLADLAWFCLAYHADSPWGASLSGDDLHALGIPSEAAFVAEYCRHSGRDGVDGWPFYLAFAAFRMASILQGVYLAAARKRGLRERAGIRPIRAPVRRRRLGHRRAGRLKAPDREGEAAWQPRRWGISLPLPGIALGELGPPAGRG